MGRRTHSWTLQTPAPELAMQLQAPWLCAPLVVSPTSQHTLELRAPCYPPPHDLLPFQGNQCHCSMGNRRHKPAGSVSLEATPQNCALWKQSKKSGPKTPAACRLGSSKPSWQLSHWTVLPEAYAGYRVWDPPLLIDLVLPRQASSRATNLRSWKPVWEIRSQGSCYQKFDPPCFQHYCTTLQEPIPGKQAPEYLQSEDFVPPCFQQLGWL
jgi:hypothetical protein